MAHGHVAVDLEANVRVHHFHKEKCPARMTMAWQRQAQNLPPCRSVGHRAGSEVSTA